MGCCSVHTFALLPAEGAMCHLLLLMTEKRGPIEIESTDYMVRYVKEDVRKTIRVPNTNRVLRGLKLQAFLPSNKDPANLSVDLEKLLWPPHQPYSPSWDSGYRTFTLVVANFSGPDFTREKMLQAGLRLFNDISFQTNPHHKAALTLILVRKDAWIELGYSEVDPEPIEAKGSIPANPAHCAVRIGDVNQARGLAQTLMGAINSLILNEKHCDDDGKLDLKLLQESDFLSKNFT